MNPDELREIQDLAARGMGVGAIAKKLSRDRKTIRHALGLPPRPPQPPKLTPFEALVRELAAKELAAPRILRELRDRGYTGSLTILKDFLRSVRGPKKTPHKVFRRFETAPGLEAQVDWSPYRLPIAGVPTVVHCFSMVLAYSRMLWIAFYRNERLPTLLHAHAEAFTYFGGCCREARYDNMTQVTLGRVGGKPLWNPRFLEFAQHYGFVPRVCRPRDPNRRGKGERPFWYIETDLVRGMEPGSWDDLNAKARTWLETVANVRLHATTKRRPVDMFAEEKPMLIALPATAFATERRELRKVQTDGYIAVDGSLYPVPAHLVGQYVTVKLYPNRVEVVDAAGAVVAAHPVPDRPGRIAAPWGPAMTPAVSRSASEAAFLAVFPRAQEFLEGLARRMKALTPIHLREIGRLVDLYGRERVAAAIERAQVYHNFNAPTVRRILEAAHPDVVPEPPMVLADPTALGALDDVEPGSPEEYPFDSMEATDGPKE